MMRPSTMRRVDYWAGIPICFLLTGLYKLQRLLGFNGPRLDERPKNVLFIELMEMGTIVVAYPAIKKLKELHPHANVFFLAFKQIRDSIELIDLIEPDNILTIDTTSLLSLVRDTFKVAWVARKKHIDTTLNLEVFVRYSTILSYLCGAGRRVGFHRFNQEGGYTGDFLTHKVSYNPHIHAAHTFLDLVHALGAPEGQIPLVKRPIEEDDLQVPKIMTDAATAERIWRKLQGFSPRIDHTKRLIIVNPNASELFLMRKLPLENYAKLVQRLLEDPDVYVLITGVKAEKPDAQYLCRYVSSTRVLDLTGETTLKELLHLFNVAAILITNDSGPAHFACLTNIHIVVFFGPELPDRYRPLSDKRDVVYSGYTCSPCVSPFNQRLTPCNDNLCLKTIAVDRVYEVVRRRLQEN